MISPGKALLASLAVLAISGTAIFAGIERDLVPFHGHTAEYVRIRNPRYQRQQPDHLRHWELIQRPAGGFIGNIVIRDARMLGATARLRIYEVRAADFFPPVEHPATPEWFEPMGIYNPGARVRDLMHERTWEITDIPHEIPVILPPGRRELNRCVFEIVDADGRILYSYVPVEVYFTRRRFRHRWHSESDAWVISDDETAHRRLSEMAGIHDPHTLREIPGGWDRFLETDSIWIDEKTDIDPATLRRIILSGGWIFGTAEGLEPHLENLGMTPMPVLGGGIASLERNGGEDAARLVPPAYYRYKSRYLFTEHDRWFRGVDRHAPMEDGDPLFSRIRTSYIVFTFAAAAVYALSSVVLLPILFIRLKRHRRVELWWKMPAAILAYTLLLVVLGWIFVQPGAPVSEVTEYRLGYGDWPEVFCNINTAVLKYGSGPLGWHYPPSHVLTYTGGDAERFAEHEGLARPGRLEYMDATRGMQTLTGFAAIEEMRQPFRVAMDEGKVIVSSERALRNVHIALSRSEWLELGDIPEGGSVEVPSQARGKRINFPERISDSALGYPDDSIKIAAPEAEEDEEPCEGCGMVHHRRRTDSISVYNGTVFLIGVDEEDMPAVTGLHAGRTRRGRVAWICQVPVEGLGQGSADQ